MFIDDEAHIPLGKILINDTLYMIGNYEEQDEPLQYEEPKPLLFAIPTVE